MKSITEFSIWSHGKRSVFRIKHVLNFVQGSRKAFTGSSTGGERGLAYSSIPGVSNYVGVRGVGQGIASI